MRRRPGSLLSSLISLPWTTCTPSALNFRRCASSAEYGAVASRSRESTANATQWQETKGVAGLVVRGDSRATGSGLSVDSSPFCTSGSGASPRRTRCICSWRTQKRAVVGRAADPMRAVGRSRLLCIFEDLRTSYPPPQSLLLTSIFCTRSRTTVRYCMQKRPASLLEIRD